MNRTAPTVDLRLGDCLDVLPTLPDASVDAVITDPPYPHVKREYGHWTEAEWWSLIVEGVIPQVRRVLKPSGSAVFILQPNSRKVGSMRGWLWEFMAWACREWNMVQDAWWWNVNALPTAGSTSDGLLRSSMKACVWLGPPGCHRDQSSVLDQQVWQQYRNRAQTIAGRLEYQKRRGEKRGHSPSGHSVHNTKSLSASLDRGGSTPFNLLPLAAGSPPELRDRSGHPAGTPAALCNWWLRYICPEGGTVLDPFCGSGTLLLEALKLGRHAIGIEKRPEYHATAERRVAVARAATPLFA